MKWLDSLWEGKIKAGFEMLVNMFSAGIWGFVMAVVGFYPIAYVVNGLMQILSNAVNWLVSMNLLPLTSIVIEPAKVLFLNNAINHGVLTPLGIQQAADEGSSILFLLEANPGPGLGMLLAFTFFGIGAARASAPGAALIQFVGGIHEVYFPYALMKPMLILGLIAGGMTGVTTNMLLGGALRAPAAPGSIIAVLAQTAPGKYFAVILSVVLAAAVSFLVCSHHPAGLAQAGPRGDGAERRRVRRGDHADRGGEGQVVRRPGGLRSGSATGSGQRHRAPRRRREREIKNIVFACDAGMGSSAMGASVLRNKIKKAGIEDVTVVNKAIATLDGTADLVITQNQLTDRARQQSPNSVHVSVDNFMNSPRYDEVVELVRRPAQGWGVGH